jgi:LysR family transcriptional activator of mexEF-oprN operon
MNIAHMDLNLLKVFEALHDEASASRAALRLGVTQSAISAALRRLRTVISCSCAPDAAWRLPCAPTS